jgi:hypothetical protein
MAVHRLIALILLTFVIGSCSTSTQEASPAPTASASSPRVSTPSSAPASAVPSDAGASPAPLRDRVLAASDLPAELSGTRRVLPSTVVVGGCNRVSLQTIGATRTAAVAYTGKDHEVVSEAAALADEATAARMLQTLRALHARCTLPTTAITAVAGAGTTAWRYLLTQTSGHAEAFGVAVSGRSMAVVSISGARTTVASNIDRVLVAAAHRIG